MVSGVANATPERLVRFASPSNVAIITNTGLIATDPGLPRIGELARRLDQALHEKKVLDHIAKAQSRFFALGSVTLNAASSEQLILGFQTTLERQSEFVSRNFGPLAVDDLPMYTATALHDDRVVFVAVLDTLAYITCKSGFWGDAEVVCPLDVFCMADAPRQADPRMSSTLELIALWPLKLV